MIRSRINFLILLAIASTVTCNSSLFHSGISDVAICDKFDICNIVHNPHWEKNSIEKLCHCPGDSCSAIFSTNDGFSLPINARSQMKFCTPIEELRNDLGVCEDDDTALKISSFYHIDQVKNVSASLLCSCEQNGPIYWKYLSREGKIVEKDEKLFEIIDSFQCSGEKVKKNS